MSKSNKIITFVKDYALPQLTKYLKEEPFEEDNNANNELGGIGQLLELSQNQEKLLELYREYFRLNNLPLREWNISVFNHLLEVKNEIKELENEK